MLVAIGSLADSTCHTAMRNIALFEYPREAKVAMKINDVWFTFLLSLARFPFFLCLRRFFQDCIPLCWWFLVFAGPTVHIHRFNFYSRLPIFGRLCPHYQASTHWIPPWVGMVWVFTIPVFRWGKGPVWSASCSPNDRYIHHLCAEKLIKHSRP